MYDIFFSACFIFEIETGNRSGTGSCARDGRITHLPYVDALLICWMVVIGIVTDGPVWCLIRLTLCTSFHARRFPRRWLVYDVEA